MTPKKAVTSAKIVSAILALAFIGVALGGCTDPSSPIAGDIWVDSTFSNDQVSNACLDDVMRVAKAVAASHGVVYVHTFDGDPLSRRGLSEPFSASQVPPNLQNTSGEGEYLEEQAGNLESKIEKLILEDPTVYGTPLLEVLAAAGRTHVPSDELHRVVICTDGLFGDVRPEKMTLKEARIEGAQLRSRLSGSIVDIIGLGVSAPGTGRRIEQTRPLVEALLESANVRLGFWGVDLPKPWPPHE